VLCLRGIAVEEGVPGIAVCRETTGAAFMG
jgi:hypothetical protein